MARKVNVGTWFEIYVGDMDRAKKFYGTVLNEEMIDMEVPDGSEGGMKMVSFPWVEGAPNASGALVKSDSMQPGAGGTLVYFTCEDCKEEESRVEKAGGKIVQSKFPIGEHGHCSICMDTEGNVFGLHSMK
ncbi:VOC family protein [Cyclobacterium plantarum]|uniref:VOC family protein n=1 Tax=Cyclobacterium plantarum TaxID=2716263 RepID=A0ABX0HFY7_9BACT|nr:VOC family protein [Cyclobacterium plantarum]NHE59254.1 VOC family protein [Cyclobacterium plantarum]